jgi:hypothetical protein
MLEFDLAENTLQSEYVFSYYFNKTKQKFIFFTNTGANSHASVIASQFYTIH